MADLTFNTKPGEVVARKLLVLYLNTGTSDAPVWSAVGKRVEDSSMAFNWNESSKTDIFGDTYGTLKAPIITQTFDPCELDSGDVAQVKIWNQAIKDQDTGAMVNNDLLVVLPTQAIPRVRLRSVTPAAWSSPLAWAVLPMWVCPST